MEMSLHIVSFNVPYPADYGGVIDVFCRLRALSLAGVRIYLHCYTYGRPEAQQLNQYCEQVSYYQRETLPHKLFTRTPYIVSSRCNKQLLADLLADDAPVLLEGLHCCGLLPSLRKAQPQRLILVRAHNVEHHYYNQLALSDRCPWHRLYLCSDARKLKRYEPVLREASHILAISDADAAYFRRQGYAPVSVVPAGHGQENVSAPVGFGKYVLYQGDLSVADNQRAVEYLLDKVFTADSEMLQFSLVVAGKDPTRSLVRHIAKHNRQLADSCGAPSQEPARVLYDKEEAGLPNSCHAVRLVANPDDDEMQRLLYQAHVCILLTRQATGVKLKLLHALYASRFCLVNSLMVQGTPMAPLCVVADTPKATRDALVALFRTPFTADERQRRADSLSVHFSDQAGAQVVLRLLQRAGQK